jgi:hypothetical protein
VVSDQWPVILYQRGHSALVFYSSLATGFPVFAGSRVQAPVSQLQALYWFAADYVGLDDFVDVGLGNVSVPDGVRIDHQIRAVLALIETARLVGPHFAFKAAFRKFLLE